MHFLKATLVIRTLHDLVKCCEEVKSSPVCATIHRDSHLHPAPPAARGLFPQPAGTTLCLSTYSLSTSRISMCKSFCSLHVYACVYAYIMLGWKKYISTQQPYKTNFLSLEYAFINLENFVNSSVSDNHWPAFHPLECIKEYGGWCQKLPRQQHLLWSFWVSISRSSFITFCWVNTYARLETAFPTGFPFTITA